MVSLCGEIDRNVHKTKKERVVLGFRNDLEKQWDVTTSQVRAIKLGRSNARLRALRVHAAGVCARVQVCVAALVHVSPFFCAQGETVVHDTEGGLTSLSDPKVHSPCAVLDPHRIVVDAADEFEFGGGFPSLPPPSPVAWTFGVYLGDPE